MADFILEIFSEEIPARMQKNSAENFLKIAQEVLAKQMDSNNDPTPRMSKSAAYG